MLEQVFVDLTEVGRRVLKIRFRYISSEVNPCYGKLIVLAGVEVSFVALLHMNNGGGGELHITHLL